MFAHPWDLSCVGPSGMGSDSLGPLYGSLSVIASGNPFEAVSNYLHGARPDMAYFVAAGTGLLLLLVGWFSFEYARKLYLDSASTPAALARDLARLHGLSLSDRQLLVEAAQIAPPVHPAAVFLDPSRLGILAINRPELADRCGPLAVRLFGEPYTSRGQ
jgi:hypothetical protein